MGYDMVEFCNVYPDAAIFLGPDASGFSNCLQQCKGLHWTARSNASNRGLSSIPQNLTLTVLKKHRH